MNYELIYSKLIETRLQTPSAGTIENHHIIPRCLGGSNDVSNFVKLTPREHFLAHRLLARIYPDNRSLLYAANMMSKYLKSRCKTYKGQKLTEEHKKIISMTHKGKKLSQATKDKIREKLRQLVPSEESNHKRSETLRGRSSPMKGKTSPMKGIPRDPTVLKKAWETRRLNIAASKSKI